MPKQPFLVIAGNIGCGKSTLTEIINREWGFQPHYEAVEGNPYLDDFYRDMQAWSFHLQVYFLTRRFDAHRQIVASGRAVVQDRSIYEDAQVFARNLFEQGYMSERDHHNYEDLYESMLRFCRPPDLVVYLKASVPTLQQRIMQRGRDCEQDIPLTYIAQLNDLYERFTRRFNLCPVLELPADDLDFVKSSSDRSYVLRRIDDRLKPLVG